MLVPPLLQCLKESEKEIWLLKYSRSEKKTFFLPPETVQVSKRRTIQSSLLLVLSNIQVL